MTARNDITGDLIASKVPNDSFRNNYDAIFRKPKPVEVVEIVLPKVERHSEVDQTKIVRDAETRQWWAYCEMHQQVLEKIPTFEEFRTEILPTLEYVPELKADRQINPKTKNMY